MKSCPRCQSKHFVKNEFVNENQRYKCKGCGYQWTRTTPRGHSSAQERLSVLLYCHGISMNGISILFDVSVPAVLKWIRAFAKKQAPKPTLTPDTSVSLELDEMWPYIGKKKNKLWISRLFMVDFRINITVLNCRSGEIRRNPQKHPSKDPKQYAEIPKQKHLQQKHSDSLLSAFGRDSEIAPTEEMSTYFHNPP